MDIILNKIINKEYNIDINSCFENNLNSDNIRKCEFCKKEFSTKKNLNTHQKTTKYCLEIQKNMNEITNIDIESNLHNCEFCNKKFNLKCSLNRHLESCKEKIDFDLKKRNDIIKELEIKEKVDFELKEKNNLIEKLENELLEYKIGNRYKDEEIKKLEDKLKRKNEYIKKIDIELSEIRKYLLEKY